MLPFSFKQFQKTLFTAEPNAELELETEFIICIIAYIYNYKWTNLDVILKTLDKKAFHEFIPLIFQMKLLHFIIIIIKRLGLYHNHNQEVRTLS